jgi:hemoglobin
MARVCPDLDSRSRIHNAVVSFYRELVMDDLLGPVFEEVAEVDWSLHIPLLIDYWCRVLLGHKTYQGAILVAHRHVHELQALTADHFDQWYELWVMTIDQEWAGPSADKAKAHAARIATSLARQLPRIAWDAPDSFTPQGQSALQPEVTLPDEPRRTSLHPAR